jgi:predicted nucleic acid-binding protein
VFIGLARIGQLRLLDALFEQVVIVPAVLAELAPRPMELAQIASTPSVRTELDEPTLHPATAGLQGGERQVISHAIVHRLQLVLLDEKRARTCAKQMGLVPRGILGVLVRARRESRIPDLRGPIHALLAADFRLPIDAVNAQLVALGEDPITPDG